MKKTHEVDNAKDLLWRCCENQTENEPHARRICQESRGYALYNSSLGKRKIIALQIGNSAISKPGEKCKITDAKIRYDRM